MSGITLLKIQHDFWEFFFCKIDNINKGLAKGVGSESHLLFPPRGTVVAVEAARFQGGVGAPIRAERSGWTVGSTSSLTSTIPTHKSDHVTPQPQ